MTRNPSSSANDADRRSLRFAIVLCLAGAAVLALSAFPVAEIVSPAKPGSAPISSMSGVAPWALLPTVPQASDVLPAAPTPDEPAIATYGG